MKTGVEDLREHLFLAIERLNDVEPDELEKEIARAKAVADVAREITATAKAEIAHMNIVAVDQSALKFFAPRRLPSLGEGRGHD